MLKKRGYLYHIMLLAALGAYVYDVVQESVELNKLADAKRANLRKRQLMDERFLAVTKSMWPECVNLRLTAEECKEFIDKEIHDLFTDKDRYVRTLIMGKRKETDELYNVISIYMNDEDMVEGRLGDGMVYYDFKWHGSGELATAEQQTHIPPILAMENDASLADIGLQDGDVEIISDPDFTAPAAVTAAPAPATTLVDSGAAVPSESVTPAPAPAVTVPTDTPAPVEITDDTYADDGYTDDGNNIYGDDGFMDTATTNDAPIQVFAEPVKDVEGATVDQYISSASSETTTDGGGGDTTNTTSPLIAGGVLTDHSATNLPEGDDKIIQAISEETVVPEFGERTIDPINCYGLTGEDCCLLIKLAIPDSDINGNAIQCTLTYSESTKKKKYWKDLRGKKVHIHMNHNGFVSEVPQISGNWPKKYDRQEATEEFESWLLKGGAPPLILRGTKGTRSKNSNDR
mmetsp:Transcript_24500/g.39796  ORF Transcript_24500/g.39796 Transcript_24500/m.39796 type:complete len:460 (+) Transcript_24500:57-1436(+)